MKDLKSKIVAIVATHGFEESELKEPKKALEDAGAVVHIVSERRGVIKSWNDGNWSKEYPVDRALNEVKQEDYDGLVIPGGVMNPDKLRRNENAVEFVRSFFEHRKPVAAICHGPWILAEADVLKDRTITSFPSIRTDMENAGAKWLDEEVVVDAGLVTSRSPKDLKAFNTKMIEEIHEGVHAGQTV